MTYELHFYRRKKENGYGVSSKAKYVEEHVKDEKIETDEHMTMLTKHIKKFLKNYKKGRTSKT